MKIFILAPRENWICDRFSSEFKNNNPELVVESPLDADIIWLLGSWCWNQIPVEILRSKKVVTTVHHIVPEKFNSQKQQDFLMRDHYTDIYHVPCKKTKEQIESLTNKPVFDIPFWVNQNIWKSLSQKDTLREKYGIKETDFVVGSFQRDTEGHDLKSPKLEKGPDQFCNTVIDMNKNFQSLVVLLAGWRRQYVISRLKESNIKFLYYELPDFETLNELYNCLDLYLVTSRYEGGPQSILECAVTKTPIVSTDVGIASEILSPDSIVSKEKDVKPDTEYAYEKVQKLLMPKGFKSFKNMFSEVLK